MIAASICCLSLAIVLWRMRPRQQMMNFGLLVNEKPVAAKVRKAVTWYQRQVGLLNHFDLPHGHGLYLAPSRQVHTLGMAFPLDVVFLGADGHIVDIVCGIPGGIKKIQGPKGSLAAIEFKAGTVGSYLPLRKGDRVLLTP